MVDERLKRILPLGLWVLAGAALVFVFVFVFAVAPSLLIGHPPNGLSAADEFKARNDIRGTLVQALAGLAVAGGLIVTYRTYRQNRAEQDRTYERELYAKAVEQLGHEKAPVRLGALYSLERLAQDKPERRQTVVDVICAYLRMPFSPTAPTSKLEPEATGEQGEPGTVRETRRTDGTGDTWRQESQVRLTAQRILSDHLSGGRAENRRSTDPTNPRFWPGIRLDLSDATLIKTFGFLNGVMAYASFHETAFSEGAYFAGATFSGVAWFAGATFDGNARFDGATFHDVAGFGDDVGSAGATFHGDAGFDGVTFDENARFDGATFHRDARFDGATFHRDARFDGATFRGLARFDGATFRGYEGSLSFERSRVLSPDAQHVWPKGWRLGPDGDGGYTVVRTDDDSRR
jgi:uncharacterized protein YjbI with pentapeptide repeats